MSTPLHRDVRRRVLDAAEHCLLEYGYRARLHATIARRAGLSRPTVYKYVGNQPAIVQALLQREFLRLWKRFEPALVAGGPLQLRLVEAIVGVVQQGRRSPLLQRALSECPEEVVPYLTVNAQPFIEQTVSMLTPHLQMNSRALAEWAYRLTASLLITAGVVPTATDDELRGFVSCLLSPPAA
jgi:AcrR family transcriptional regulator